MRAFLLFLVLFRDDLDMPLMGPLYTLGQADEEFSASLNLHQANCSRGICVNRASILFAANHRFILCKPNILKKKQLLHLRQSECGCDAISGSKGRAHDLVLANQSIPSLRPQ